jgi:hypothetical protein
MAQTALPVTSTAGSIQYKINGSLVKIDNANLSNGERVAFAKQLHGIGLPSTRYLLNAQKGPDIYDSASVNNNFAEFTFDLDHKGQMISLFFSTDNVDVNISSYENSRISGTFTARLSIVTGSLSDYATCGSIFITEGVFNNVLVNY